MIKVSLDQLIEYIESEGYQGWDPYDGLKSPIFKSRFLRESKLVRFGIQQLIKRSPLNLRGLLRIPKGYNPVTLGLSIQGYSYLIKSGKYNNSELNEKIKFLIAELTKLSNKGYSGACWGYDFDWEARHANIPAYQPTIVATGIVTNALFECYKITGNTTALDLCISSSDFVLKDLNRNYEGDTFCFSYSPLDHQQVYNASMKGVRLLSQVYSVTKREELKTVADQAVRYIMNHQNGDGSWFYANKSTSQWIDNYHTGYVLDCLDEYICHTGQEQYKPALEKGFAYYVDNFFEEGYKPKFYNRLLYPIDCTAAGQALLTLVRFGKAEMACKVAQYTISVMQNSKGYFYFRQHKWYTQRTSFMRWSNAWMFVGLSQLVIPD